VPPKKAGLFRYLKEAFMFRWNVLLFGGAAAAAVISGHADIALPLVAAAEITYLAGLTTLPRFQSAIDAKASAEERGVTGASAAVGPQQQASARDRILEVLKSLAEDRRARFLRLRARCVEMSRIANAVRGDTRDTSGASAELRQPALDRLLWVFLRLLLSDQAIARFLQAADEAGIDKTLGDLKVRRKKRADSVGEANQADDRIIRSIDDSISTAELRKENIDKAKQNAEFVEAELDRLENKIHAVTEMAVGHTDPDEMSSRIDAISEGISQTEQTIRELQSITGVADAELSPSILETDLSPQRLGVEGGASRRPPGS
jgi:chemotaxis protein histidine kinase CheA